ncbi:VOC family protein [Streptomyces kunmingensis]|uniref:VOC family protein n=1 Tax=Streptomyces kunmingensis TaxID=68225 RepID=A0ABU6CB58_9ACTN|nr:VOC family protein [Streptomyces kunmingensis]MEB3961306.1 VOC family protein [Streptomyces kunmingensis]
MQISKTPSAPCWADLSTTDTDGARIFYEALFGWRSRLVEDQATDGYSMFALDAEDGQLVAGVGPVSDPRQPSAWLPYFQSSGVEAVTARVRGNRGRVLAGPVPTLGQGRLAVCQDPSGAQFGLWEPLRHAGFEAVNVPSSFCWFELLTRDGPGAVDFYQSVLGWGTRQRPFGDGGQATYTEWTVADEAFGGVVDMSTGQFRPEVPSHWNLYVAVDAPDATAARCEELGGRVLVAPTTIPTGRFALLADPQGAAFAVMHFTTAG